MDFTLGKAGSASRFDFVVITFEPEIAAVLLQARSLARCGAGEFVGHYHVIWNAKLSHELRHSLSARLAKELDGSGIAWTLRSRHEVVHEKLFDGSRGNFAQQVLKMAASRLVTSNFYCVLDSKNHAIRPFEATDFVAPSGRLRSHGQRISGGVFGNNVRNAMTYFGFSEEEVVETMTRDMIQTTTPFMLATKLCREMIDIIESREGVPFARAFLDHAHIPDTNEFYLYYAFILRTYVDPFQFYEYLPPIYVTFFNRSPFSDADIKKAVDRMGTPEIKFLGLHRGRKTRLTPFEFDAFFSQWQRAGLFSSPEAAEAFLLRDDI